MTSVHEPHSQLTALNFIDFSSSPIMCRGTFTQKLPSCSPGKKPFGLVALALAVCPVWRELASVCIDAWLQGRSADGRSNDDTCLAKGGHMPSCVPRHAQSHAPCSTGAWNPTCQDIHPNCPGREKQNALAASCVYPPISSRLASAYNA